MELKENLKLGLLGIIAVTLIINTFFMGDSVNTASSPTTIVPVNQSNKIAPQVAPTPAPIANPVQVPAGPTTTIAYSEEVHNFGNIKQKQLGIQYMIQFGIHPHFQLKIQLVLQTEIQLYVQLKNQLQEFENEKYTR